MKGGETVEKQTSIYLTEKDLKRLEIIKNLYETTKNTDAIKILIKEEYDRIKKYKDEI